MRRARTTVWLILFLAGGIGLAYNALVRPNGMAQVYVERGEKVYVEAVVAPPLGAPSGEKAATKWLPSDDAALIDGRAVANSAQPSIKFTETRGIAPRIARERRTAGDTNVTLSIVDTLGVWIAAFFTLAIFSFLWRDNPVYKFAESVLVGVSAAYWMTLGYWSTLVPNLFAKLAPEAIKSWSMPAMIIDPSEQTTQFILALVPLILGFMLLMRLSPKGGWISVWPLAFIIGTTAGLKFVAFIEGDLMAQASNTIAPLVALKEGQLQVGDSIGNVVLLFGVLSVLTYFFFSIEHKGRLGTMVGKVSRVGIWYLMITFGAAFGLTVMGRITLLSQRLEFLFGDWLWIIDPANIR
ncbi:MAG: hypothetical protein EXS10_06440 [Phycisphaerales bacterium]|nr:hypothetical protein [Phycisphaerales bacterium]